MKDLPLSHESSFFPLREVDKLRYELTNSIEEITDQYQSLMNLHDVHGLKWLEALTIIELLASKAYDGSLALYAQDFLIAASTTDGNNNPELHAHAVVTREALRMLTQAIEAKVDRVDNKSGIDAFTLALPSQVLWKDNLGKKALSKDVRIVYHILKNKCFIDRETERANKTRSQVVTMLRHFRREIGFNSGVPRKEKYKVRPSRYLHLYSLLEKKEEYSDDPDDSSA